MKESINRLIPFVEESFITFPLWEEGNYIPSVNIWQIIPWDYKLLCDDKNIVKSYHDGVFLEKPKNVVVFVNSDMKTMYRVSPITYISISFEEDVKEDDINLSILYNVAYGIIRTISSFKKMDSNKKSKQINK